MQEKRTPISRRQTSTLRQTLREDSDRYHLNTPKSHSIMRSGRQQDPADTRERRERRQARLQIPARVVDMRRGIGQMFSNESRSGRRRAEVVNIEPALESPKTPRLVLGQNFSTTRLAIPYLNRPSVSLPSSPVFSNPPPVPARSSPPVTQGPLPALPRASPTHHTRPGRSRERRESPRRDEVGVEPADAHLAELADIGRRRRKGKFSRKERRCGPKFKHRRIRAKALSCMISGLVRSGFSQRAWDL